MIRIFSLLKEFMSHNDILEGKPTLLNLPNADIKSAHSLEYSKFFKALSIFDIYVRYRASVISLFSSINTSDVSIMAD